MKLAIKGHSTRGKEVIQLLEMLGGENKSNLEGTVDSYCYYIDDSNTICSCSSVYVENVIVFTLEEFEEKFPYKVGDKVVIENYKQIFEILSVRWCTERNIIMHQTSNGWYSVNDLQPYKEEGVNLQKMERNLDEALEKETTESLNKWLDEENMNTNSLCTRCVYAVDNHCGLRGFTNDFNRLYCSAQNADKLPNGFELQPDGYFSWVDSKPTYPKTYKECCDVLSIPSHYNLRYYTYEHGFNEYTTSNNLLSLQNKLNTFGKLIICRNAYWKIAGEQMGLDKPWEPDYDSGVNKYGIIFMNGAVQKSNPTTNWERHLNKVLEFPTAEMRDAFFENFEDLIEECKELL